MTKVSPTDMAFEGLRLTRERPKAILAWAGVNLLIGLVSSALIISLAGPETAAFIALSQQPQNDPAALMTTYGKIAPAFLLVMPLTLLYFALLAAAVNRVVLRPDEADWHGLALGKDELRQLAVLVLLVLLFFVLYLGFLIVALILAALVGVMAAVSTGSAAAAGLGVFVAIALVLAALLFVAVRLSLAGPLTFAQRRIRIFGSWRLTRGRFWPLFGGYLLAFVLIMIIYLLGMLVALGAGAALGGLRGAGAIFRPDFTSFESYFTPLTLAYLPFASLLTALTTAIHGAAAAEAYRQITEASAAERSA